MAVVFMTRRQYDAMCGKWAINGEEQKAYLFGKRWWSIAGVKIKTDNQKLLDLIKSIKSVVPAK